MIKGVIHSVGKYVRGEPREYDVHLLKRNKLVTVRSHTERWYPLYAGDYIAGEYTNEDGVITLTSIPSVTIPLNGKTVEKYLGWSSKSREMKKLNYMSLLKHVEEVEKMIPFVNDWCARYVYSRSTDILDEVEGIMTHVAKAFLNHWYKHVLERQVLLFGVENNQRSDYPYLITTLIDDLGANPFRVPIITMEQASEIYFLGPENLSLHESCGEMVRWLWEDHKNRGHSYTPVDKFYSQFPDSTEDEQECLMSEYHIVAVDDERLYFDYAHKAEQIVVDTVIRLSKRYYTCTPSYDPILTKEQKKATDLVLSNGVSILTGGPGTGKCLHPNTLIRMSDKSVKRAADVKVGDNVMGFSSSRLVLRTGRGYSSLYEVITERGDSFICNDEHMMTVFIDGAIKDVSLLEVPRNALIVYEDSSYCGYTLKEIGMGNHVGFELDGDGRFVLANGIVTHNTTILRTIVNNFKGRPFRLVSFTGKAVSRANEVLEKTIATTIHRSLITEKTPDSIVIIEEASMVSTHLLARLLLHFNPSQLIFVGDVEQLTPIDWGSPMKQLVESGKINIARLQTNHRVSDSVNGIVVNSQNILTPGKFNWIFTDDFQFKEGDEEGVLEIIDLMKTSRVRLNKFVVLTPYSTENPKYKKVYSKITRYTQELYLSKKPFTTSSDKRRWYVGDRVMLLKNINELFIYNGMEAVVESFDEQFLNLDFGEISGKHEFSLTNMKASDEEIDNGKSCSVSILTHAYCLSVDKSQGSEKDVVIYYIPYDATFSSFLNRNRTYTAITRAKKCCYLVGKLDTFTRSTRQRAPYRRDYIKEQLEDLPLLGEEYVDEEYEEEYEEEYNEDEVY